MEPSDAGIVPTVKIQDPRYIIDNRSYYSGPHFEPNDPRNQAGFVYGLNLFKMSNNRIAIAPNH